jgi:hypothetical protein
MDQQGKPVDIVCVDPFKHDGEHIVKGQVLEAVAADLAKELAGNGRARLAKAEDKAAWQAAQGKAAKAAKAEA